MSAVEVPGISFSNGVADFSCLLYHKARYFRIARLPSSSGFGVYDMESRCWGTSVSGRGYQVDQSYREINNNNQSILPWLDNAIMNDVVNNRAVVINNRH